MTVEPVDYDFERWIRAFDNDSATFTRLREEVQYTLESAIAEGGLKTHSIVSRVKGRDSFRGKLERKQYVNPMAEMRDIVAARIVCLFPSDVDKIGMIIRNTFDVVHYDDKGKDSPPEIWRYQSVHYDCKIKDGHRGPRYDGIKSLIFEIQVRTILQDAWATVEHYLAYKGASSIPAELKRDFSALVGLFHVADKSFQQIYDESITLDKQANEEVLTKAKAVQSGLRGNDESRTAINRSTLKALCNQLYPDRKKSPDGLYSEFVEDLTQINLRYIDELQELLLSGRASAESRESDYLRDHKGFDPLSDIGLGRLTVSMLMPEFGELLRGRRKRISTKEQSG